MTPREIDHGLKHLKWGEGSCPHCHSAFQVNQDAVRFFTRHHGDAVLFMLCPACASIYDRCTQQECSDLQDTCLDNIKNCTVSRKQFACTTVLTVAINHGDYAAALENGIGSVDRSAYELLIRSDEALIFANGTLVYWERLPATISKPNSPISGGDQDLY